jgi:hypothetical protein
MNVEKEISWSLPVLVLFWTICQSKTRQARMNTQKRIDLTVEFTKNPRFFRATELRLPWPQPRGCADCRTFSPVKQPDAFP